MLKTRILTALLLGPLSIYATLALPSRGFGLILGLIFCLGAWEWASLARLVHSRSRLIFFALFGGPLLALWLHGDSLVQLTLPAVQLASLWWLMALGCVLAYPRGRGWTRSPGTVSLVGLLSLLPAWMALVYLHERHGSGYALLLFFLVWGADIGAYFAGRALGRRKLAPAVSPNKTWAGVGGGLTVGLIVASGGAWLLGWPLRYWPVMIAIALCVVAFSIVGDLLESLLKREAGLKDSGRLLPGHGGMLDRIDSLLAAAPVFMLGLYLGPDILP